MACVQIIVVWWIGMEFVAHDDVIKWKHFPHYWPFVRGNSPFTGSPVNSPHKGQWRGALIFSLICGWINGWVNEREAGYLRCRPAHYDVTVMKKPHCHWISVVMSSFYPRIVLAYRYCRCLLLSVCVCGCVILFLCVNPELVRLKSSLPLQTGATKFR